MSVTTPVLKPPDKLTAEATDEETFKLNWEEVHGADSYDVYRSSESSRGPDGRIKPEAWEYLGNVEAPPFIDKGLKLEEKYWYAVVSVHDKDKSSWSKSVSVTTPAKLDDVYVVTFPNGMRIIVKKDQETVEKPPVLVCQ